MKINHGNYDKCNIAKVKKLFPSLTTIHGKFSKKTITISDFNCKLNAYKDILVLPSFNVLDTNADSIYFDTRTRSYIRVVLTDVPYVSFNVFLTYTLNFYFIG